MFRKRASNSVNDNIDQAGKTVALLEQHHPGWGASGRNGGQVIPGLKLDPDELVALFGRNKGEQSESFTGAAPDLVLISSIAMTFSVMPNEQAGYNLRPVDRG